MRQEPIDERPRRGGCLPDAGAMNAAALRELSPADRELPFSHPEYGALTVDYVIHQMAGHQIHHLKQLEGIQNSEF